MAVRVKKWGHSLAVRIPKLVAEQASIQEGTPLAVVVENGRIVLTPEVDETLENMLGRITPDNIHDHVDWGPPVGKEIW